MSYQILKAVEMLESAIEEMEWASTRAAMVNRTDHERQLREKAGDIRNLLKHVKDELPYIMQPKFERYFKGD